MQNRNYLQIETGKMKTYQFRRSVNNMYRFCFSRLYTWCAYPLRALPPSFPLLQWVMWASSSFLWFGEESSGVWIDAEWRWSVRIMIREQDWGMNGGFYGVVVATELGSLGQTCQLFISYWLVVNSSYVEFCYGKNWLVYRKWERKSRYGIVLALWIGCYELVW